MDDLTQSCGSGCSQKGMCPGIAHFLSVIPAQLLYNLTGREWLFIAALASPVPVLVLGLHKNLPLFRKKPKI